ncbi:addiction module antidote protein, HigA family [Bradyrhizobium sp. AC87j1]|uniref:HigA family addiction module antitoxin n=1 Tax=Bradyrhizobium sp. AC87j1 TaxID=2055894 RepID=UPI000CECA578|nr:HigA family addiction module antitoxin [Bradyrhizobium sp. AC87j1]PPQ16902.1 addiction module antidote protein, HigA family [Bradyrhizobium sp. AC87j1]
MHGPVLRSKRPPSNLRGLRSAACGRRKGVRRWQGKLPPIHPGEILREEFLVPLKLTPHAVAAALNVPRTRIARIAPEEKPVTADAALRLGKFFKTGAAFWINIQTASTSKRRKTCSHLRSRRSRLTRRFECAAVTMRSSKTQCP